MTNTIDNSNQILFVSSYFPKECGIAVYSKNLLQALSEKFDNSFSFKVCALEREETSRKYPDEVKFILNTSNAEQQIQIAERINKDENIKIVFIQHEFSLFEGKHGENILYFLYSLMKPIIITFHTVLPNPDHKRKQIVKGIAAAANNILVMTNHSVDILIKDYDLPPGKISLISHGTHLINSDTRNEVKEKLNLQNRIILSTFGLLRPKKSIETALDALPAIAKKIPNVLYLIIGKSHPESIKTGGEEYRRFLENKVLELNLENHVKFINKFLTLEELLVYLQLIDIYLFTSKDPYQAVSGTFAYAMSCGCPVISTPIPHAREMLANDAGIIFDFQNHEQLAHATIKLLENPQLMRKISQNALHKIRPTVWENSAIAHAIIFQGFLKNKIQLKYNLPEISLKHIKRLTDNLGIMQFSNITQPDINSGYTLDDNAHALIALCMYYRTAMTSVNNLSLIDTYLSFIEECQQPDGSFLNYINKYGEFDIQNKHANLEDSNARAILALGILISHQHIIPATYINRAERIIKSSMDWVELLQSSYSMAIIIKGLYFYNIVKNNPKITSIIQTLADNLIDKYEAVSDQNWNWFEPCFSYGNSTLPEGLLYAYLSTGQKDYELIAKKAFDFLLTHLFKNNRLKFISNNALSDKEKASTHFSSEQPIEVSYIIQSLQLFYEVFNDEIYKQKVETAFSWFLGNNYLNQVVYDPLSCGCNNAIEKGQVSLNQGAESITCYLIARMIVENYKKRESNLQSNLYIKEITKDKVELNREIIGFSINNFIVVNLN